jgi:hypothetical protein
MSHFGQVVLSSITAIERGPKLFDIRIDLRIRLGGTVGRILVVKTKTKKRLFIKLIEYLMHMINMNQVFYEFKT